MDYTRKSKIGVVGVDAGRLIVMTSCCLRDTALSKIRQEGKRRMASSELVEIITRAEMLPPDEQLQLIAHIAERARQAYQVAQARRKWREIRGMMPYPMLGEDAREWGSRSRREAEEHRDKEEESG